jgi:hypothetical protein
MPRYTLTLPRSLSCALFLGLVDWKSLVCFGSADTSYLTFLYLTSDVSDLLICVWIQSRTCRWHLVALVVPLALIYFCFFLSGSCSGPQSRYCADAMMTEVGGEQRRM